MHVLHVETKGNLFFMEKLNCEHSIAALQQIYYLLLLLHPVKLALYFR